MDLSTISDKLSVSDVGHRRGERGQDFEPYHPALLSSSSHDGRAAVQTPGTAGDNITGKHAGGEGGDPSAASAVVSSSATRTGTGPTVVSDVPHTEGMSPLRLPVVVLRAIDAARTSRNKARRGGARSKSMGRVTPYMSGRTSSGSREASTSRGPSVSGGSVNSEAVQPRLDGFRERGAIGFLSRGVDADTLSESSQVLPKFGGPPTTGAYYEKVISGGMREELLRREEKEEEEEAELYIKDRSAPTKPGRAALKLAAWVKEEMMISPTADIAARARKAADSIQRVAQTSKNLKGTCQGQLKKAGEIIKVCVSALLGRALDGDETETGAEMALLRRRLEASVEEADLLRRELAEMDLLRRELAELRREIKARKEGPPSAAPPSPLPAPCGTMSCGEDGRACLSRG